MQTQKAYILRIDDPVSIEYAKGCAESCDSVNLQWQYFQGYQDMKARAAWLLTGIPMKFGQAEVEAEKRISKGDLCSAGHGKIWKTIAEGKEEVGIVLEHDAIMLQSVDIHIPDGVIAVLGYKLTNPEQYDHVKAGKPKELIDIDGHEGAHAYAITKKTAQMMIAEIEDKGVLGCIDNAYFIKKQRKTKLPLMIVSPTPAIGWIRESTIWSKSAIRNYDFISSFKEHYTR